MHIAWWHELHHSVEGTRIRTVPRPFPLPGTRVQAFIEPCVREAQPRASGACEQQERQSRSLAAAQHTACVAGSAAGSAWPVPPGGLQALAAELMP